MSSERGFHFWMILLSLCLALFLSALEFTAISTALPTIAADLTGGNFVWVGAAYGLAASAILPMSGGIAQVFGRRPAVLGSITLFAIGSAICGAAKNMPMLIAGRTVQGIGGGGILSLSLIVLADLVPLEERGVYAGLIGLTWSVAAAMGPLVGGSLADAGQWRWLFYLNIPLCALSGILASLFLHLPIPPGTIKEKVLQMDWIGNLIVIAATCSAAIALTQGGVNLPWQAARILSPLIIGLIGLAVFLAYETLRAKHPLVPFTLLANRTSSSGYMQTFLLPVTSVAIIYYAPVYFQACKDASAIKSGVLLLGVASIAPAAILGGASVKLLKCYRPQLWVAWGLQVIGMSLMTLIKLETHIGVTVGFCVIFGLGAGVNYSTQFYPIQAPLPISANAHALAFLSFLRSFAGIWGVTLGGAILQNELHHRLPAAFTSHFPSGVAVVYSAIPQIRNLPEPLKTQVQEAFVDSLRVVWNVTAGVCALGFLSTLIMKDFPLHGVTDEAWGLKEREKERQRQGLVNPLGDPTHVA